MIHVAGTLVDGGVGGVWPLQLRPLHAEQALFHRPTPWIRDAFISAAQGGRNGNTPGDILRAKREREREMTADIAGFNASTSQAILRSYKEEGLCKSELDGGRAGEGCN